MDRLNHPMLITVVLLLFKLEYKKELNEEVKSQWSSLRGFNRQHSKFYIMPQPTNLFSCKILLAKFNKLTSLSPYFLGTTKGPYTPTGLSSGTRA